METLWWSHHTATHLVRGTTTGTTTILEEAAAAVWEVRSVIVYSVGYVRKLRRRRRRLTQRTDDRLRRKCTIVFV